MAEVAEMVGMEEVIAMTVEEIMAVIMAVTKDMSNAIRQESIPAFPVAGGGLSGWKRVTEAHT